MFPEAGVKSHLIAYLQYSTRLRIKLRRAKGDELIRRSMFFKNCKPTTIECRKTDQKINANLTFSKVKRIFADRMPADADYAPALAYAAA